MLLLAACGPAATPTPVPTNTPIPTATVSSPTVTPRPTATPRPSATPKPSATPLPTPLAGWTLIQGDGVTLQLPDSFDGGKLSGEDFDNMITSIKLLGTDYAQYADNLKNFQSLYLLWAYDSQVTQGGFLTNVAVARLPVLSTMKLETVADQITGAFPKEFKVTSQEEFKAAAYTEARKLIIDATIFNRKIKEVIYLLKDKSAVWMVLFATSETELKTRMIDFDQSAQTLVAEP